MDARNIHHPIIQYIDGRRWRVYHDFHFRGACVPRGFITDGVSIPRIFWTWARPTGTAFPAALVHDMRYATGELPKDESDLEFWDNLLFLDIRKSKAKIMYSTVHWFGDSAWEKHARRRKEEEDRKQHFPFL